MKEDPKNIETEVQDGRTSYDNYQSCIYVVMTCLLTSLFVFLAIHL